jgi:hypothetical protein
MWITAAVTLMNTGGWHDPTLVLWTSASSDKVPSHSNAGATVVTEHTDPMRTAAVATTN